MKELSSLHRLYALCNEAEVWQLADPDKSALAGRKALEYVVSMIYFHKKLEKPERASLFQLVDGEAFKRFVNSDDLLRRLHYIRKVGNQAAHSGGVRKTESFFSLLNLYEFVGCVLMQIGAIDSYPRFDKTLISAEVGLYVAPKTSEEKPFPNLTKNLSTNLMKSRRNSFRLFLPQKILQRQRPEDFTSTCC